MQRIPIILFSFLVTLLSNSSFSSDDNPCNAQNGGAYTEVPCMVYKLAIENKKLNEAYKEALIRSQEENEFLPDDVVALLKKSQESWLTYKDSHCEFEGLSRGAAASWSGWHIDNCKLQMTLDRMKYLNAVFWG